MWELGKSFEKDRDRLLLKELQKDVEETADPDLKKELKEAIAETQERLHNYYARRI